MKIDYRFFLQAKYKPALVPEEEYEGIVIAAISETGAASKKDMGRVIGAIKSKFGIRVDGGKISSIVKEKLNSHEYF